MGKSLYKNAQTVYIEENDRRYYFTKDMLENNIVIEEYYSSFGNEEEGKVNTWINVIHQNTLTNTKIYTLYCRDHLNPINIYRIVKDILGLWEENTQEDFINFINDDLSILSQSSSRQDFMKLGNDVMYDIKNRFDYIKSLNNEEEAV
ncbi:hypothetical protein EV581_104142 [Bacillus sp. BK006]|nr:hypothetical protein EV581_104142 [Bacillus sp. BK006]